MLTGALQHEIIKTCLVDMRWSCRLGWGPEMLSLLIVEEFGP